jgi:hypothetical protein
MCDMSFENYPPTSPLVAGIARYTRIPPQGTVDPISSLNRTALDKLIRPQEANDFNPPVRTKILRARGARRGTVLIDVESLLSYLASLPEEQPIRKIRPDQKRSAPDRNQNRDTPHEQEAGGKHSQSYNRAIANRA